MSRRTLLGGSAAAVAAAYVASFSSRPIGRYLDGVAARLVDAMPAPDAVGNALLFTVERDSDLVLLDFSFIGFELDTTTDPVALVAQSSDALAMVQFPPQAIGEGVYPYPPKPAEFDPPPVLSVLAGPSQLVFGFGEGFTIALSTMTVDDLLDWTGWTLLVPPVAEWTNFTSKSPALPTFPEATVVECPYGLFLSPVVNSTVSEPTLGVSTSYETTFAGTVQPPATDGVTECWTATLNYSEVTTVIGDPVSRRSSGVSPRLFTGGSTPLEPLVSAVWSRELELWYGSGKSGSTWPQWTTAELENEIYCATPLGDVTVPEGE